MANGAISHGKISFTKGANPQGCFGTYSKVQFIMFRTILATVAMKLALEMAPWTSPTGVSFSIHYNSYDIRLFKTR